MEPLRITRPTDPQTGLSTEEVQTAEVNRIKEDEAKSYKSIFLQNFFTFFNILNFVLAFLVILTGRYQNMMFLGIVFSNIIIGSIQEIRAKHVLDKLALIHQQKYTALRNGVEEQIPVDEIAMGDILILHSGSQIPVDGVLISGELSLNESALTGESLPVDKFKGDSLYSGCFVNAGAGRMQVVRVAEETYAAKIIHQAKRTTRYPSQLRDSLDSLIKFCTVILIPAGILLFIKSYFVSDAGFNDATLSTVAAMVGMIPEGLVILSSIALALSSIRLAREDVLVQELYCIETLARVDTLCLDKTGTITTGEMSVEKMLYAKGESPERMLQDLADLYDNLEDDNATARSIRACLKDLQPSRKAIRLFPFSSSHKIAAANFEDCSLMAGAYTFMMENPERAILQKIASLAREGFRVIALAKGPVLEELKKGDYELLGLIVISDTIRPDAKQTLEYFEKQGVSLRIISGDDPATVAAIAARAGVEGKWVDLSRVPADQIAQAADEYTIFGRVGPYQKEQLVCALKNQGRTVAMTGDGVNDVMALKEADCSIAMGTGTQAARSVASLVLLDDQFEVLPSILLEGRKVINNIQRTASLFLVKTLFSFMLSILTLFFFEQYPFQPVQLTLISTLGTGLPAFLLTLEPNYRRVEGNFLTNVLSRAFPGALNVTLFICLTRIMQVLFGMSADQFSTACTILAGINALGVLAFVCRPINFRRGALVIMMSVFFVGCLCLFPKLLFLVSVNLWQWIYVIAAGIAIPYCLYRLWLLDWKSIIDKVSSSRFGKLLKRQFGPHSHQAKLMKEQKEFDKMAADLEAERAKDTPKPASSSEDVPSDTSGKNA